MKYSRGQRNNLITLFLVMVIPVTIVIITLISIISDGKRMPDTISSNEVVDLTVYNLDINNETDGQATSNSEVSDNSSYSNDNTMPVYENIYTGDTVLSYTDTIDDNYLSKCVFLGDSRMVGMVINGYLPDPQVCARIGITHIAAMSDTYRTKEGNSYSFTSYLDTHQASVIYICYGINGMDWINESTYKSEYSKLVDLVVRHCPYSKVVIMSAWPVEDDGMYRDSVKTEWVNKYNQYFYDLAVSKGIYFLNVNEILTDPDGTMKNEYDSGDGLHYNGAGGRAILDYIKHHPVPDYNEGQGLNVFPSETFERDTNSGRNYDSVVDEAVNNGELVDTEEEAENTIISDDALSSDEEMDIEEAEEQTEEETEEQYEEESE